MANDNVMQIDSRKVEKALRNLIAKTPKVVIRAQNTVTEQIATICKERTPKKFGTLRDSVRAVGAKQRGGTIESTIVAGSSAEPYARAVHEHPSEHSPPSWEGKQIHWSTAGTGSKFIEGPVFAAAPKFAELVAEKIDLGDAT